LQDQHSKQQPSKNMRTADSSRLENDLLEDFVATEEVDVNREELADAFLEDDKSDDDSLLPPPETTEGSEVGQYVR
jgi:hypothetical protein